MVDRAVYRLQPADLRLHDDELLERLLLGSRVYAEESGKLEPRLAHEIEFCLQLRKARALKSSEVSLISIARNAESGSRGELTTAKS